MLAHVLLAIAVCQGEPLTSLARQQTVAGRVDKLGDPLEKHILHRFGTRRFQHPDSVLELCVSKDEKTIISYGRSVVIGWDAASGKKLWSVERNSASRRRPRFGTGYGLRVMARAAGTGEIVSLRTAEGIPLWDPRTGETTELSLEDVDLDAKSIDISADGQLIAVGSAASLAVYSRDGKELFELANNPAEDIEEVAGEQAGDRLAFPGEFSYARFAPGGKKLALVNSQKPRTFQVLNSRTGDPLVEIATTDRIVRFVFSPDSRAIIATERDSAVRLYDVATGKRVWETKFKPAENAESYASAVDVHPNGSQIAVGAVMGPDRTVRLLDSKTGEELHRLEYPGWRPWTLHYSSSGDTLLCSGWDGTVHRWQTDPLKLQPLPGGTRATSVCSIAGKGGILAHEDSGGTIHIADQKTGDTVRRFSLPGISWSSVQFNSSGNLLAAAGVDKKKIHLVVWRISDGAEQHHWRWDLGRDPHSVVYSLSFSGNQIAANVFRQSAAYVWDLTTGEQVTSVRHRMAFGCSLKQGKLVTVGWDRRIVEWDANSGKELRSLTTGDVGPGGQVGAGGDTRMYSVRLSNDRSLMVANDMTRSIHVYDRNWNEMLAIPKAGGSQRAFALSRNELWVSYASTQLNVFDVVSGDVIFQATAHRQGIDRIEFGPGDNTILTGADDGICNLWQLPTHRSEIGDDKLFANLIGMNGKLAFAAFRQLEAEPDRAAKLLESRLAIFADEDVSTTATRKNIVALGSGRKVLVDRAKSVLFEMGPGVVPIIEAELTRDALGGAKKQALVNLAFQIHRRYRRASMLLAQLNSDLATAALKRLARLSESMHSGKFFAEALQYRLDLE